MSSIKEFIHRTEGLAPDQYRFTFQGRQLDDSKPLTEYGIFGRGDLVIFFA